MTQSEILEFLRNQNKPLTTAQITELTGRKRSAVSANLKKLIAWGEVKRTTYNHHNHAYEPVYDIQNGVQVRRWHKPTYKTGSSIGNRASSFPLEVKVRS
jgi:predicted transcriptional regulator